MVLSRKNFCLVNSQSYLRSGIFAIVYLHENSSVERATVHVIETMSKYMHATTPLLDRGGNDEVSRTLNTPLTGLGLVRSGDP